MKISFTNNLEQDIKVSIYPFEQEHFIKNNETLLLESNSPTLYFKVEEFDEKLNSKEKILSIILGGLLGAILNCFNYFNLELLKDSIKFPTYFRVEMTSLPETSIYLQKDAPSMHMCSAYAQGTPIPGEVSVTKSKFNTEKKKYYESLFIVFFPPFLLITLVVLLIVFKTQLLLSVVICSFYVCIHIPFIRLLYQNKKFSKYMLSFLDIQKNEQ